MRRVGPCFSSCLLVLYLLCGQVSFSSPVLRAPRGLITLPPLFIFLGGKKRGEARWKKGLWSTLSCHTTFHKARFALGACKAKTHCTVLRCVCMSASKAANFWWNSLDQRQIASWCHLILSEGYCICYFRETQLRSPVQSTEHTLKRDDVMVWTTILVSCN